VSEGRRPPLPPGPYLVVGLARSGAAAARVLAARGEEVAGCDAGTPAEAETLPDTGVEVHLGTDGAVLVERARTVVKSPGVPAEAPAVRLARELGREILGELELAWRLLRSEMVAVTGTNGKTTTCELLGAIHRAAGADVEVAGNVGTPLAVLTGRDPAVVVCECSSFQLEDATAFAPECAVLLNVEEDHLDRHGTLDAYRAAKLRIFARQRPGDVAVLPLALAPDRRVPDGAGGRAAVVTFGSSEADLSHSGGELRFRGEPLIAADEVRLRGVHNLENAMAAAAAALSCGIAAAAVAEALGSFPGVRHRLEEVTARDGVLYVNDSKATNVASARVGIGAFEGGVHAILGGSLKGGGFAALRDVVGQRCRACYLIGEAADRLADDLAGTVPLSRCGDLERAVAEAGAAAVAGETVLLSPACASFDQYRDYEARGDHFRTLALAAAGAA
jgi:UDP-N-acetylmuramoylalanine--D-glutamate ligase